MGKYGKRADVRAYMSSSEEGIRMYILSTRSRTTTEQATSSQCMNRLCTFLSLTQRVTSEIHKHEPEIQKRTK